jgi:hypothetical protein
MMLNDSPTPFQFNRQALAGLARLLATENITVVHEAVETAYFDTENRLLALPEWDVRSLELYHMLVEHEVAHAIWTTPKDWKAEIDADPSLKPYLNVVEDARIERLFKRRFPGSRRDFRIGYEQLFEMNIFDVKTIDPAKMSLGDRLNLFFKFGEQIDVPFYSTIERNFIRKMETTESFEDVVRVAKELRDLSQSLNEQTQMQQEIQVSAGSKSDDGDEGQEGEEEAAGQEGDGEGDVQDTIDDDGNINSNTQSDSSSSSSRPMNSKGSRGGAGVLPSQVDQTKITTNNAFENAVSKMAKKPAAFDRAPKNYIIPENLPYQEYIIGYKEVLQIVKKYGSSFPHGEECFQKVSETNKASVNFMYSQFEMKKAARAYSRAREDKTGIINPSRLHAYTMSEDLFKRTSVTKNAKNHGFVMLVDFSASMSDQMYNVIAQTMALVSFCRKAKIPHIVYGFSDNHFLLPTSGTKKFSTSKVLSNQIKTKRTQVLFPSSNMRLLEIFSNKMNANEVRLMSEALLETYSRDRYDYHVKTGKECSNIREFNLSGTPLNCGMVLALPILKDFKKETKSEVVSLIVLTDGESGACGVYDNGKPVVMQGIGKNDTIRSASKQNIMTQNLINPKKLKNKYDYTLGTNTTPYLAQNITDHGFNTIMYRIDSYQTALKLCSSSEQIILDNTKEKMAKAFDCMVKNKSALFEDTFGFKRYYIMSSGEQVNTYSKNYKPKRTFDEVRVGESSKTILKAFQDSKTTAINSRRIMSNFIETISSED